MRKKLTFGRILLYLMAFGAAFVWLMPTVWMALASLKPKGSVITILGSLLKGPFTLDNYRVVSESAIWLWMKNSLVVGVISTLGALALDSLAAYALSYLRYPGRRWVFWFIMIAMMVPIETQVIPMYQVMLEFGLMNSYLALILPAVAAPFGVFILKQFYDGIPREIAEAARIDGAGHLRIFTSIFLPLSRSAMVAVGLFSFIGSWNNFLWPFMVITKESRMTVPVGLPMFSSTMGSDMIMPLAASFLASIPTILVFVLFQKHIIKGISMTGLKG